MSTPPQMLSASPRLHAEFLQAIPCAEEDPSNKLLDVEPSQRGCARLASWVWTATGSGVNWHCSRVSSQPLAVGRE
jgi:hypothetical protein